MIVPMTKYSFILLNGMQDSLLETLQATGLVDITRSEKNLDSTAQQYKADIELIDGLLHGLDAADIPESTQPRPISNEDIVRICGSVLMQYSDAKSNVERLTKELASSKIWGHYDKQMLQKLSDAGIPIHFHVLSNKAFKEEWASEYALSVISKTKNSVYFVVAADDNLPGEVSSPRDNSAALQKELDAQKAELSKLEGEILTLRSKRQEFLDKRAQTYSQLDKYIASCTAESAAEDTLVTLVGYAPTENEESICATLDQTGFFYLKENAKVEDNPPISLKNRWFVKQFELFTDMYGRPGYDGFDPTPFISIFFMLFFALCMGDAGYGLVLILLGLALKKVESFKDISPLVVILGVATVVVGFFLHTFFSMDIAKWEIFQGCKGIFLPDEIAGYAGGMVLSIVVGIIHLCLAMTVKAIESVKNKGFVASLGTLGWTLLIVGGVVVGAFALTGVLSSEVTKWIVIVLGVVSALGIFVFNDPNRNKFANIGMGLWDTYNTATGILGDVLSYLRLYALGLAGSMLGMAFNDMGMMVLGDGSNYVLWIPFVLLVLIGHVLNIAMAALGAFVHPLRLNFLEFFKNSGYEAKGRNYKPLKK